MKKFLWLFKYAAEGITHCIRNERNCTIHCIAAIAVIIAAFVYKINHTEWMIVLMNIALVISLEMLNTAIEKLCNLLHPQHNPVIKTIKDVAAGAVLIAALVALVYACIIFIPKIF